MRRHCKLSRPRYDNLVVYEKLRRPLNLFVNLRWTDSSLVMSCLRTGFQTTELNSRRGGTKTLNALVSNTGSRDWKQRSISLARREALETMLSTCGENLGLLLYAMPRSVIRSTTGSFCKANIVFNFIISRMLSNRCNAHDTALRWRQF